MKVARTHHRDSLRRLRPWRWLAVVLLTSLLSACGGGGGGESAAGNDGQDPTAITFQLLPARLSLSKGGEGGLIALRAPGALAWSSSDPAVASVDADGLVTALAPGSAVVSASSGGATTSVPIRVFAATATTGSALIDAALARNLITAEQAMTYRVFALFGDARLPAEFVGAPDGAPDHALMRRVSAALPTLSPATRDTLLPFLIPPIYAESWFAQQRLGLPPVSAAADGRRHAAGARRPSQTTTVNCRAEAAPHIWKKLTTDRFNVFYLSLGDGVDPVFDAYNRAGAELIASVAEEVYAAENALLQREPLSDIGEGCNGGDGKVDLYLTDIGGNRGLTQAYPDRCNRVPSFVAIDASDRAVRNAVTRPADARREMKGIVAHELAHVLQFAMDRVGNASSCDELVWLDEATAEWAMDHVDATWNQEDGAQPTTSYRRAGAFYRQYLLGDHMVSIEKPGVFGDPSRNGYADYLFFQYLVRKYGDPGLIKQIFDQTEGRRSVEAVEAALAPKGGMKVVWPEFAMTLWNDPANQNLDDFSRWDGYDFGLAAHFERRAGIPVLDLDTDKLKSIDIEQRGAPRESFRMLKNALERPAGTPAGDFYEIQPRSIFYEHLRFTDPTVSSVYFFNPLAVIPDREFIKVQARMKIGGVWQATEDWTNEPYKQFCLDKKDERIEELLIVVSNSEVNRGSETPFRYPKLVPMQTSTSNVGCWRWLGGASVAISGGTPVVDSLASGVSMLWVVSATMPGRLSFGPSGGVIAGNTTITDVCTTTMVGASLQLYRGLGDLGIPKPDGTIDVNLDLDLGFGQIGGEPPDRKLITLAGASTLDTTTTAICPAVTQTAVGPHSWSWLQVDDVTSPDPSSGVVYTVSSDGRTIEGRFTGVTPTGSMINTLWKFTAVRE